MTTAAQAAQRHLAELADGEVSPRDKPSAFHHGLIASLVAELDRIVAVVAEQANDEGLWFEPLTGPEGYLQSQLRRLHRVIDGEP